MRVARVSNNMFSSEKSTALLSSDVQKLHDICENADQLTDRPTQIFWLK